MKWKEIKDVTVDKISLVSSKENPAVEKASMEFAIFKTIKTWIVSPILDKIKKILSPKIITKDIENSLDRIKKILE